MCCYNRPFDDQSQLKVRLETEAKLFIQQKILDGDYDLTWSYVLDYENKRNPYENKRSAINEWSGLAKRYCIETDEILKDAEQFRIIGIRPLDALHLACAKSDECDYFLTTDKHLLTKLVDGIRIASPLTFFTERSD